MRSSRGTVCLYSNLNDVNGNLVSNASLFVRVTNWRKQSAMVNKRWDQS